MQAWGNQESKFVIKRTMDAPTKSGIIGLLCAAKGISRETAQNDGWLKKFSELKFVVRIDRPGIRWWDYHTVGAKIGNLKAEGGIKITAKTGEIETLVSRREYLCDASFLVAIQCDEPLLSEIHEALLHPEWALYLGRKSCPPSVPICSGEPKFNESLEAALKSIEWRPRFKDDIPPESLEYLMDWIPDNDGHYAPQDAEVWYDIPDSFVWPSHHPRFVIRKTLTMGDEVKIGNPTQNYTPAPERLRANYTKSEYVKTKKDRMRDDKHLCVFCKSPATDVHHITYRHAGGGELKEELRSLCKLCHDAMTMIEYGENMGLDRIDPTDIKWRDLIIQKRTEIIQFRSLETRRRKLLSEDE
jgi:CRISPR system Cascade subunit CasD